jgi:hypothetical protein
MTEFDAVGAQSAERTRRARTSRTSAEFVETEAEEKVVKRRKETTAKSLGRTHGDSGSIVLEALWACMSKQMNFSGAGNAQHAAAPDSHRIRCTFSTVA